MLKPHHRTNIKSISRPIRRWSFIPRHFPTLPAQGQAFLLLWLLRVLLHSVGTDRCFELPVVGLDLGHRLHHEGGARQQEHLPLVGERGECGDVHTWWGLGLGQGLALGQGIEQGLGLGLGLGQGLEQGLGVN